VLVSAYVGKLLCLFQVTGLTSELEVYKQPVLIGPYTLGLSPVHHGSKVVNSDVLS